MKVYVDDIRNPVNHLSTEQSEGIVWLKEWWKAKNFIFDNASEIEVVHLDNFLAGSGARTGGQILTMMTYRFKRDMFPNLKQIYLHSSDTDVVDSLYEQNVKKCNDAGVELIKNSRPNRS